MKHHIPIGQCLLLALATCLLPRVCTLHVNAQSGGNEPLAPPVRESIPPSLATPAAGSLSIIPVVVVRFLPTRDGVNLDTLKMPEFYSIAPRTLAQVKGTTGTHTERLKFMVEEGSRFRGYKNPNARPSLGYQVVDILTFYQHTPAGPFYRDTAFGVRAYYLDYTSIMEAINGRDYVENRGVKEFWIWHGYFDGDFPSYQLYHDQMNVADARALQESNMSSPTTGDISNSWRFDDLPLYNRTYTVYEYDIGRTQAEAMENHCHQMEALLSTCSGLFWPLFVGRDALGNHTTGRCGWTHMPPNTTKHYDWYNPAVVMSDIEDWRPDGLGARTLVGTNTWESVPYAWPGGADLVPERGQSQWKIFWFQSMPGFLNGIPNGNQSIPNWWQYVAEWDQAMTAGIRLPTFTLQPQDTTGPSGMRVVLSAAASSPDASLSFQWQREGQDIPGTFQSTLIIEAMTSAEAGRYRVLACNIAGATPSAEIMLKIDNPTGLPVISTSALPEGRRGRTYDTSLLANDGLRAYQWSLTAGILPEGLTLDAAGNLAGIPNGAGQFAITVRVTSANQLFAERELSFRILDAPPRNRIAGRTTHSLAILGDGRLLSWGANSEGQLGTGDTGLRKKPTPVAADGGWIEIGAGGEHSVGLKRDGSLWTWGANANGQLGNGGTDRSLWPVKIGGNEWAGVAAGVQSTLAIKQDGTLWAWGRNDSGQLGLGDEKDVPNPTQVGSDHDWLRVFSGWANSMGVKTDGSLWTWGDNFFGRLGTGDYEKRLSPQRLTGSAVWAMASLGYGHGLAVQSNGTLCSWGWNGSGQLGLPTADDTNVPTTVGMTQDWGDATALAECSLALKRDGTLWSWGNNSQGALGTGNTTSHSLPDQVGSETNWTALGVGANTALAIKADGSIWAWGHNSLGQLGDGSFSQGNAPVEILPPAPRLAPIDFQTGPVAFQLVGRDGLTWIVQTSTNLSQWTDVTTLKVDANRTVYTNGESLVPVRFFQLRSP